MFVKILGEGDKKVLILNVDCISTLDVYTSQPKVTMANGDKYLLTDQQYDELCKILTTRL